MRDVREIAEKVGEARAKYEQANKDILERKGNPDVAEYWGHELALLEWVLGDERTAYPIVVPQKG